MRAKGAGAVAGLALAVGLLAAAPARADLLSFNMHLNGGYGSFTTDNGVNFSTARAPLGLDFGVNTGIVPLLDLQFFVSGMTDFNHDGYFSLGARVLYELSDHFDLGVAGNAGYSVDFNEETAKFAWLLGPHLQFHFFILNLYFQPTYANGLFGGGSVIYPFYGGAGLQF